jgi:uncharacterized protein (TIGR02117 family)
MFRATIAWLWRAAIIAMVGLWGCATSPSAPPDTEPRDRFRRFFVVDHGWHTGLVIAMDDLMRQVPALAEVFADAPFVDIGWGDEDFYFADEPNVGHSLQAILWPTATVLHVAAVSEDPRVYFADVDAEVIEVTVSEEDYLGFLAFVASSFARSPTGEVESLGPGLYGVSRFYRATGSYHAFYTCNTWTAEAVAASGVPVSSNLALTADTVMDRLREAVAATPR